MVQTTISYKFDALYPLFFVVQSWRIGVILLLCEKNEVSRHEMCVSLDAFIDDDKFG